MGGVYAPPIPLIHGGLEMPTKKTAELDAAEIELEWKRLQVEELRAKIQERNDRYERLEATRRKQLADFEKAQQVLAARQRVCKHRKGGRDNKFHNGNDNNYSVIRNTYPTGETAIMCTRCFKEVRRPDPRKRKENPELYKQQLEEWRLWDSYPTDNSPSGGKIFEIIPAAA